MYRVTIDLNELVLYSWVMVNQRKHSPEQLLALFAAAISDAPPLVYDQRLTPSDLRWLGRVEALMAVSGPISALTDFRIARSCLGTISHDRTRVMMPLYFALSSFELLVPASLQGAYIPPGDTWNGYAALVRLIQIECDDLLIVDPYLSSDFYLEFAPHAASRSGVRCLTSRQAKYHPPLLAAAHKWDADPLSDTNPVAIRYAPNPDLHDRLIIVDHKDAWLISQSIKDIARRSPASVTKGDSELAALKVAHYNTVWDDADPLC